MSANYPIPIRRGSLYTYDGLNAYYLYGRTLTNRQVCVACLGDGVDGIPDAADFAADLDLAAAYGFRLVNNKVADILAFRIQMQTAQLLALPRLRTAKVRRYT